MPARRAHRPAAGSRAPLTLALRIAFEASGILRAGPTFVAGARRMVVALLPSEVSISMAQSENPANAREGLWAPGRLSIDDLERLANAIRPSWEIGLDVAAREAVLALPVDFVPSAQGFAPAPAALASQLGAMVPAEAPVVSVQVTSPSDTPLAPQAQIPSTSPRVSMVADLPARSASLDGIVDDKLESSHSKRARGALFAVLGGAVAVVAGVIFFVTGGGSSPAAGVPAPAAASAPSAAAPSVPLADPPTRAESSVLPASAPARSSVPAPLPAPRPATMAEPLAPSAAPVPVRAVAPAAASRPVTAHVVSRVASPPLPARPAAPSAPRPRRAPRGVGFVTDSPY